MSTARHALLVDAVLVAAVAAARMVVETARGLVAVGSERGALFVPSYAWWWARARWLGGWNPWIYGGFPANADPLLAPQHPFGMLYAALSPNAASALEAALAPATAAIGMLVYLHAIGCGRTGRVVGALAFALGGFVTAHAEHPSLLRATVGVPWALAAIEALAGRALVAGVGAAVAAIVLGGHPQPVAFALLLVIAYGVVVGDRRRLGPLAAGVALGLGIGAATWLPAFELVRRSIYASAAPSGLGPHVSLVDLGALVVPTRAALGSACTVTECSGYPGMLAWIAVLGGAAALARDPRGRFWLGAALAGVVLSTGVLGVLGMPGVRAPSRWLLWWQVGMAAAAGLALSSPLRRTWPALVVAAAIAVIAVVDPGTHRAALVATGTLVATAVVLAASVGPGARHWALVALVAADLVVFAVSIPVGIPPAEFRTRIAPLEDVGAAVRARPGGDGFGRVVVVPRLTWANWAPFAATRLVQGFDRLAPTAFLEVLYGMTGPDLERESGFVLGFVLDASLAASSNHALDLLRCRFAACPTRGGGDVGWCPFAERAAAGDARWQGLGAAGDGMVLFENRRVRPVAWLVHRVRVVSHADAIRLVRGEEEGFEPANEALVEAPVGSLSAPAGTEAPVDVVAYGEDEVRLAAVADTPALLVTSELAYPGWRATVDGTPVDVATVNGAFRAVVVPAGRHEVAFAYRPRLGHVGLVVGGTSLVVLLACAVSAASRRR